MSGARTEEDLAAGEAYGVLWVGSMWGWFDPEPGLRITVQLQTTGEWRVCCAQISAKRAWEAPTLAAAITKAALADWGRS